MQIPLSPRLHLRFRSHVRIHHRLHDTGWQWRLLVLAGLIAVGAGPARSACRAIVEEYQRARSQRVHQAIAPTADAQLAAVAIGSDDVRRPGLADGRLVSFPRIPATASARPTADGLAASTGSASASVPPAIRRAFAAGPPPAAFRGRYATQKPARGLPQPLTDTTYTTGFIVDSTDNPGGQSTLTAGDTITVTGGPTVVGNNHVGVFTQNGGTFNVSGSAFSLGAKAGSTGTYNLDGGSLTANAVSGGAGTSTFNFNGGTLQAQGMSKQVFFAGLTTANVQAGGAMINTNGLEVAAAQNLLHDNGLGSAPDGGLTKLGAGTLILAGANTYNGGTTFVAGTITVGSEGALGAAGALTFNGGTLQYSNANQYDYSARFSAIPGQTYNIETGGENVTFATGLTSVGGSLNKSDAGMLTLTGVNTFTGATTVTGGTLSITAGSVGVHGSPAYFTVTGGAAVNLSGGSLTTDVVNIGSGSVTQTGGSFTASDVTLANGLFTSATYTLNGGTLSATGASIGLFGPGTFTQTGGSFSMPGDVMDLGADSGGDGTYLLSGTGSLSTGEILMGRASIMQSGGSLTTNGSTLYLGYFENSTSSYGLSGGTLTTGVTQVTGHYGAATFSQTGGTHITGKLSLTDGFSSFDQTAVYNLGGGTLQTGGIVSGGGANGNTSIFHFNGGTLQASGNSAAFMQGLTTADVQAFGARIDTQGYNVTIAQTLVHDTTAGANAVDDGLTKSGTGTLVLTGANTYTGITIVNQGTLQISSTSGSATGTGLVEVFAGATLTGNGFAGGNVIAEPGSVVSSGVDGPGVLNLGNHLTLDSGSILTIDLDGTVAGSGYDQVDLGTAIVLEGGNLSVQATGNFKLAVGEKFFIVDTNGTPFAPGAFGNAPGGIYTDAAGDRFAVDYLDYDPASEDQVGNDISLTVISVVPEPSTWALAFLGVATLMTAGVRRHIGRGPGPTR